MTLGAFLGTFSYALMVLRTVRTHSEGEFIPHLALTVSILLSQLQRHADLVLGDAARDVSTPADLADLRARHAAFETMRLHGAAPRRTDLSGEN